MEVLRAHRDVGRGSLKKRRVEVTRDCTDKVVDRAFSLIKADQLAPLARPFPYPLCLGAGSTQNATGLVVNAEGTDSANVQPLEKESLNRTTFLLRADGPPPTWPGLSESEVVGLPIPTGGIFGIREEQRPYDVHDQSDPDAPVGTGGDRYDRSSSSPFLTETRFKLRLEPCGVRSKASRGDTPELAGGTTTVVPYRDRSGRRGSVLGVVLRIPMYRVPRSKRACRADHCRPILEWLERSHLIH
ncbi:hypothetical protein IFM89_029818 [Coptis chinensis]|uniref:Uncharacterized protein n=1 Tax=Coptis chinensis TaxID=261450 RepID=A0A835HN76_9MAGN|nr:hypothetical protein IFM89_029818 [Coptis chinensis]